MLSTAAPCSCRLAYLPPFDGKRMLTAKRAGAELIKVVPAAWSLAASACGMLGCTGCPPLDLRGYDDAAAQLQQSTGYSTTAVLILIN